MVAVKRVELTGLPEGERAVRLVLETTALRGLYRDASGAREGVLFLAGPAFEAPGDELYTVLGRDLASRGIAALRLELEDAATEASTLAARAGAAFLRQRSVKRLAVVGFGARATAALQLAGEGSVSGAALLSPPTNLRAEVALTAPRLLVVAPGSLAAFGREVAASAEQAELVIYRQADARLGNVSAEVRQVLLSWLVDVVTGC